MNELEEIKARVEKATPGPWQMDPETHHLHDTAEDPIAFDFVNEDAALFIAHARTDIPKLIAALEAVEAYATRLECSALAGYQSIAHHVQAIITEALK